jgi:mRNA interferase MazF
MPTAKRGEVWIIDLGFAAKVRPCLVLSVPAGLLDRALVTVVAHTTSVRGSAFEVVVTTRFLPAGVFDAQNLLTVPEAKLIRRAAPCSLISLRSSSKRSGAGWDYDHLLVHRHRRKAKKSGLQRGGRVQPGRTTLARGSVE